MRRAHGTYARYVPDALNTAPTQFMAEEEPRERPSEDIKNLQGITPCGSHEEGTWNSYVDGEP